MSNRILLIGSAPLENVFYIAGELEKKHNPAEFTLLLAMDRAGLAGEKLSGWRIMTYPGGPLAPWSKELPPIEDMRQAAVDGVYYACNDPRPHSYLNLELLARWINMENARAILPTMRYLKVIVPEQAVRKLWDGDASWARALSEARDAQRAIELSVKSVRTGCPPSLVSIMMEPACNYKCLMCHMYDKKLFNDSPERAKHHTTGTTKMRLDDYFSLIDQLAEMGVSDIAITAAGEPLLDSRTLPLLRRAAATGMCCYIVTNGYGMTKSVRESMLLSGVNMVTVSLNAGNRETFSKIHNISPEGFERVVHNVECLISERDAAASGLPVVGLSFVISRANIHETGEMLKLSAKIGVDRVRLIPVYFDKPESEFKIDENDMEYLCEKANDFKSIAGCTRLPDVFIDWDMWPNADGKKLYYAEHPCYIGWGFSQVTSYGDVLPCCVCKNKLGNVLEKPFAEIWNGPEYIHIRGEMLALPAAGQSISGCGCFSFCPHTSYSDNIRKKMLKLNVEDNVKNNKLSDNVSGIPAEAIKRLRS